MINTWVEIKEELPPEGQEVLVFCKWDNSPLIAHHDGKTWHEKCDNLNIDGDAWVDCEIHKIDIGDVGYQITHWMPLPESPKE